MLRPFKLIDCREGMFLHIETLDAAPDIHQITGFGGIEKGKIKFGVVIKSVEYGDSRMVTFEMKDKDKTNITLLQRFFINDDVWETKKTIYNPFGMNYKFSFCDQEDLPKTRWQVTKARWKSFWNKLNILGW